MRSGQAMVGIIRGGRIRQKVLELGLATEDDLEEMAKAWEEWQEREDAIVGMMHGELLVQKQQ
jgi:hypothetical protein